MPHTLGKPDCPLCKGRGVRDGESRIMYRPDGSEIRYPTVYRCSCLEAKPESAPTVVRDEPDAQKRAAGERE